MKARTLLSLGFLLFFAARGESQAWHPLPNAYEANRYDYRLSHEPLPQYPVKADTLYTIASDTVLELHHYPLPCATCSLPGHRYHPGIAPHLGTSIRATSGSVFTLNTDSDSLTLRPKSTVGTPWAFSIAEGWSAWIDAAYDSLLWESHLDSVKRILITTGDTLLISKRHGILRYPSAFGEGDSTPYRLSGIQGIKKGLYLPDWRDMLDMEVGMLLQYKYGHGGFSSDKYVTYLVRVTGIEESDSIKTVFLRGAARGRRMSSSPYGTNSSSYCKVHGSISVTKTGMRIKIGSGSNLDCNGSARFNQSKQLGPLEWYTDVSYFGSVELLDLLRPVDGPNGRVTLTNCQYDYISPYYCSFIYSSYEVIEDTTSPTGFYARLPGPYLSESSNVVSWTHGLGYTGYSGEGIDNGESMVLTAYRMADESWGTIDDTLMWPLNSIETIATAPIQAFPNPNSGHIYISGWDQTGTTTIIDMTGRTVLEQPFQPGIPLDLSTLPNGLYWIELRNEDQRGLAKVSILRP